MYDGLGRVQSTTATDGEVTSFSYDAADRLTTIGYADGTNENLSYNKLDMEWHQDRGGFWTHYVHNVLQQLAIVEDPRGKVTFFDWCACGVLSSVTDPGGNTTNWFYDVEGRPTTKTFADNSSVGFSYEKMINRLKSITDAKGQSTSYTYNSDNTIAGIGYSSPTQNAPPAISLTYDPAYRRVLTMNAGTGGNFTYTYNPVNGSTLGANQLASLQVSGSFANYTVAYQYDEWARSIGRTVDGSANSVTWSFDSLGRVSAETNLLGSFTYAYAGATGRLQQITPTPANAPQIYFAYNDTSTSGDRRLNQIRNLSGSTLVSQFDYSYSPRGQISRWQQQNSGSSQITGLSLQYDPMGQLVGASNQDTASSAQLASNAFSYDPAGNRTSLQLDSQLSNETFNSLNQLVAQTGANGSLHFTGTVNKPSTVTVGGQIAQVDADGNFDALVPVISGVNQVTVTATDVNHSTVNSAQTYQVTVSPVGAPLSGVSYDANGNLTADGTGQTYEYDSLDRVTAINESATLRTEFAYDGLGRRAQMIERSSGAISSQQNFVYDGWTLAEQRDTGNSVLRRYFAQGEQRLTTADTGNYFYTFDHLGSVRELLDNTGAVRARYEYDVWGNRTKLSGDLGSIGEGQAKYRKRRVFFSTLLSFVLYSLSHAHEVPARQG